jgi:predicted  nucleic acid-binding Zn-ribbon protein
LTNEIDQAALRRLLDLQTEDTTLAQLERRRAGLPEAERLATSNESLAEMASDLEIARKQHDELVREQTHIEGEMGLLEQKIVREEGRLFSGGVSNPRELGALQTEIAGLKTRRGEMENSLLEVMVQREQAAATLETLQEEHDRTTTQVRELTATVAGLNAEIDGQLAEHSEKRNAILPDIPDQVLSLYEQLREQKGGVGAAALRGDTCEGCHTRLPSREVEQVKAAGGLQRCDNCRRILVII